MQGLCDGVDPGRRAFGNFQDSQFLHLLPKVHFLRSRSLLSLRPAALAVAVLSLAPAYSQVFPESAPANRPASGALSLRNLALGELRFTDTSLFNLFDQGGSPMGLLETHPERVNASVGMLRSGRASGGDSLTLGRHEYYLPQLAFFQPGVFGAVLYFQREGEEYRRLGADTMDLGASRFGLDLAAGPASGLFRIGFGMHGRMGNIDYPGADKRVFLEAPSLRLDMGSRVHPRVEIGAFTEFGGRFDSLESPAGRLERVANFALPRYGLLADVGGGEDLPLQGNAVFERGIDRSFGEYRTRRLVLEAWDQQSAVPLQGIPAASGVPVQYSAHGMIRNAEEGKLAGLIVALVAQQASGCSVPEIQSVVAGLATAGRYLEPVDGQRLAALRNALGSASSAQLLTRILPIVQRLEEVDVLARHPQGGEARFVRDAGAHDTGRR